MVVLLALTLNELSASRDHIASQDAKITALFRATRPAIEEAPALIDDARPLLREAAPALGDVLASIPRVAEVGERVPALITGVQGLANVGIPLAQELQTADLPALVAEVQATDLPSLAAELRASDLPQTLDAADALIASLTEGDRLVRNLDTTTELLTAVAAKDLPRRAVQSSRRLRDLLKVQRKAYATLRASEDIQVELLQHVRSIDEKLGGQLPPLGR